MVQHFKHLTLSTLFNFQTVWTAGLLSQAAGLFSTIRLSFVRQTISLCVLINSNSAVLISFQTPASYG